MRELIYPQYTDPQIERIEFMFMLLNTLYLEWRFYKHHLHSEEEFDKTLDSLMKPLGKNIRTVAQHNSFLIDDFEKLFLDFPDEFKDAIYKSWC